MFKLNRWRLEQNLFQNENRKDGEILCFKRLRVNWIVFLFTNSKNSKKIPK